MENHRPDPDELLRRLHSAEQREHRAKLKIFIGMSAGVGKTYAMLSQAREVVEGGRNVLVGVVETHGRTETMALLQGLRVLPRKVIHYRDTQLEEFDLDAVLVERPSLVLIDELAHTNAPGGRHAKRFLDVLELLNAGIDVWTTLNIQHIESLTTDVERITGIRITETVPNSVIDRADEIELIDLPPAALQKRLAEGKVYAPERADLARSNFFRTGNLTALRELALRVTADRVDKQLRDYMTTEGIVGPWKTRERLLVAVSPSPSSAHLIRYTRRLSDAMEAPWLVLHVHGRKPLSKTDERTVTQHLRLARELGAEVLTMSDDDVVAALLRVATRENVTRIIVGKPGSSGLKDAIAGTGFVARLLRRCGAIDVTIVPFESETRRRKPHLIAPTSTLGQYAAALSAIAVMGVLCSFFLDVLGYQSIGMIMLLAMAVIPLFVGRGPVIAAAVASAFVWDYFFIPPRFTIYVSALEDVLLLLMMFTVGLTSGLLSARIREREGLLRQREHRAVALYALTKALASATSVSGVVHAARQNLEQTFAVECTIAETDDGGKFIGGWPSTDHQERAVAEWVASHKTVAGKYTETLSSVPSTYHPLIVHDRCVGVVAIKSVRNEPFGVEQEGLLQSSLQQIASAIERERLRAQSEKLRMSEEGERLHSALLSSISHELRTPLSTIKGAAGILREETSLENCHSRRVLADEIVLAAERLNRLVSNLLDMSRLEADRVTLNKEPSDVADLVSNAISELARELESREVKVDLDEHLPLVDVDAPLIVQSLVNLLNNAILYTPANSPIYVRCAAEGDFVNVIIRDQGNGIPLDSIDRVFQKFYRAPDLRTAGTGLGLSITKGFVESHGGRISVRNAEGGGAEFTISLPSVKSNYSAHNR